MKCIKYSMFVFNLVFWLVGCALLGVGIWFLVDSQQFLQFADNTTIASSQTLVLGLGIGAVVVGGIIMITGFLGCCGAVRESACMLTLFFCILILIFGAMISLGVIAIVHQDWIKQFIKEIMNYEVKDNISDGLLKYSHDKWGCCGVESMAQCDQSYPPTTTCIQSSNLCANGCLDSLWNEMLAPMANGAAIALLVTCGILVRFPTTVATKKIVCFHSSLFFF